VKGSRMERGSCIGDRPLTVHQATLLVEVILYIIPFLPV
jgi:hypothetical protein